LPSKKSSSGASRRGSGLSNSSASLQLHGIRQTTVCIHEQVGTFVPPFLLCRYLGGDLCVDDYSLCGMCMGNNKCMPSLPWNVSVVVFYSIGSRHERCDYGQRNLFVSDGVQKLACNRPKESNWQPAKREEFLDSISTISGYYVIIDNLRFAVERCIILVVLMTLSLPK
jgi:hypothetical protein